uniref:RUN domain-containing protein n=1 Tax=Steinernema glaseri TaxID=37863 RepID=A0A1I7YAB4_9BILA
MPAFLSAVKRAIKEVCRRMRTFFLPGGDFPFHYYQSVLMLIGPKTQISTEVPAFISDRISTLGLHRR